MTWDQKRTSWVMVLAVAMAAAMQGCEQKSGESLQSAPQAVSEQPAQAPFEPLTIQHELGTTIITSRPQRVAVYDMNEVDSLDQLGVPISGMPKDFVPHFLAKYQNDPDVKDLGSTLQPNLEQLHALKPDLVLIAPIQARSYQEMTQIAPTLHFDVDFVNKHGNYIGLVKEHLITLGRIFGKEDLARQKAAEIDTKVMQAELVTKGRPEKALIVMHNNGAFSSFGMKSRYGFVFDTLGVKPASTDVEPGLHGQPISNEFISAADPDILYVIDRTAAVDHRPELNSISLDNPLLRQTKAWKNGRVVFVDSQAWYLAAASVTSLKIVIDEVIEGYQH